MRIALLLAASLVARVAIADPDPADTSAPTPWSQGVSPEVQTKANLIVAEANELFAQQAHARALEKYSEALALWDHPSIRFNMAVTLLRLDRYVEADEALTAALRYGSAPFPPEKYQQALDYQKLVARQIGTIVASCNQAGVQIRLDGKTWFSCPGKQTRRVLAGEHSVAGDGADLIPQSRSMFVAGNTDIPIELTLLPLESGVKLEYPTRRWIPWTTATVGLAIGLAGVPIWVLGRQKMDQFDRDLAANCADRCEADLSQHVSLRNEHDAAVLEGRIGVTMMVAGGAAAAAGVVWGLFLNRPRRILPTLEPVANGAVGGASWTF